MLQWMVCIITAILPKVNIVKEELEYAFWVIQNRLLHCWLQADKHSVLQSRRIKTPVRVYKFVNQ
jgi:hypothetical protein